MESGVTLLPTLEALRRREVWIVQHDDSPHNTVLGVFATDDEAYAFMDTVKDDYENGVICSSYSIPYRSADGAVRYQARD